MARVSCSGCQECRVRAWVVFNIITGFFIDLLAVATLLDSEFAAETYCHENNQRKPGPEFLNPERYNNTCQSETVLDYKVEDLEPYLKGGLVTHIIAGVVLTITGVVALVGLHLTKARLVWPWVIATGLWIVSLFVMAFVLAPFGLSKYIWIMVGSAFVAIPFSLDVGHYCWKIPRTGTCDVKHIPLRDFGDGRVPEGNRGAFAA